MKMIIHLIKDIKMIVEIKVESLKICHKLIVSLKKIKKYHNKYNLTNNNIKVNMNKNH